MELTHYLTILLSLLSIEFISSSWCQHDDYETSEDKPVQLVMPDQQHKGLKIVESNLKYLRTLEGPVAVVGVVGKFHSGKSFLMNQLMGKSNGFGIGPSVQPKTMGIWMWGKPLRLHLDKVDQKVNLIFLDTEGFAANNVTERYDAKVFAVSTLLSSHLLYNSVKIIDQSDIEYLELLARRTQLFALRSQMSKSKWTSDFNQDLLTFPPLTWVVQDFVQETQNKETPTEWLHRLMGSHSRESDNYTISLLDIFERVDCHTLFIPAFRKDLLMDMSQANDEDLSKEYRWERDELKRKLLKSIVPKEKNDQFITGSDLARLMQVLVTAANDGSLADVPSRWDSFVDRLQVTASLDCAKFYQIELDNFLQDKNEPVSMRAFELFHNQIKSRADELLRQLLHGLEDALVSAQRDLDTRRDMYYTTMRDLNEKKIKAKLTAIGQALMKDFEDALRPDNRKNPRKPQLLNNLIDQVMKNSLEEFSIKTVQFQDETTFSQAFERFKEELIVISEKTIKDNEQIADNLILRTRAESLKKFTDKISPKFVTLPMNEDTLNQRLTIEANKALEDFNGQFGDYKDCCNYNKHLEQLTTSLKEAGRSKQTDNIKAYKEIVDDVLSKAKDLIKLSQDKYNTVFSLDKFINDVCNSLLSEGRSRSWTPDLKRKVIDEFMEQDVEIKQLLNSKQGFFSTILGILEWLCSFIGL